MFYLNSLKRQTFNNSFLKRKQKNKQKKTN